MAGEHQRHGGGVETTQRHLGPTLRQLGHGGVAIAVTRRQLVRPVGPDEQHGQERSVASDPPRKADRRRVRPVQILQHEHHRRGGGDHGEDAAHRVEGGERLIGCHLFGPIAEHALQPGTSLGPRPLPDGGGHDPAEFAQHLDPGPVAGSAVTLPARAGRDHRPAASRPVDQRTDQRRLADARLSGHEQQSSRATGRFVGRLAQGTPRQITTDQSRPEATWHLNIVAARSVLSPREARTRAREA